MRVALFIDGKNFYSGWKQSVPDSRLDFHKLAQWLVVAVGGTRLWGAYYYTGIETGESSEQQGQRKLAGFLNMLELEPGFFVKRFPRKARTFRCQSCQALNNFTQEKEVDTTMVADMLRLAAVDAFDLMVLVSGDADHAPAVEGVRSLGKQVYVASWEEIGLASRIRKAAFDHINLHNGLAEFGIAKSASVGAGQAPVITAFSPEGVASALSGLAPSSPGEQVADADTAFLRELRRAQGKFSGGYVGASFFLGRWESPDLEKSAPLRGRILDRLVADGKVEVYVAPDGNKALRIKE
jgi:uncharacterized LabA/DUF88 family protein